MERERFAQAVQEFYNAAIRLQRAWDDLVRVDGSADETPEYPFSEDYAEIVHRIGGWSEAVNPRGSSRGPSSADPRTPSPERRHGLPLSLLEAAQAYLRTLDYNVIERVGRRGAYKAVIQPDGSIVFSDGTVVSADELRKRFNVVSERSVHAREVSGRSVPGRGKQTPTKTLATIKKGDKVYFGSSRYRKTLGRVTKVHPDEVEVEQLESEGMLKQYPVGTMWVVGRTPEEIEFA